VVSIDAARCSLFVLIQVEFDLTFEWQASDVPWNMLICALEKRRGKKKREKYLWLSSSL